MRSVFRIGFGRGLNKVNRRYTNAFENLGAALLCMAEQNVIKRGTSDIPRCVRGTKSYKVGIYGNVLGCF